jgi:hypothetical protein
LSICENSHGAHPCHPPVNFMLRVTSDLYILPIIAGPKLADYISGRHIRHPRQRTEEWRRPMREVVFGYGEASTNFRQGHRQRIRKECRAPNHCAAALPCLVTGRGRARRSTPRHSSEATGHWVLKFATRICSWCGADPNPFRWRPRKGVWRRGWGILRNTRALKPTESHCEN